MVVTGSTRNRFVSLIAGHVGSNPTLSARKFTFCYHSCPKFDKTGFTGLSGYFLPFQMKGKNSNPSSRDLEIVEHIESESKINRIGAMHTMKQ